MYCLDCGVRDQCVRICPRLESHLHSNECYQREYPFDPKRLGPLAHKIDYTWVEMVLESSWLWEDLPPFLSSLPQHILLPFLLHYYEGKSISGVARMLGLHRITVNRRIKRSVILLREEMERQGVVIEKPESEPGADDREC